jgi:hypothetical protein
MLKKSAFCFLAVALLLSFGDPAFAKGKNPSFTITPPSSGITHLSTGETLNLRNSADLTVEERELALQNSCGQSIVPQQKAATFCAAFTGPNCTGTGYAIPCGLYINAGQQVPPQTGFLSFLTGCAFTAVSACADFACTTYVFDSAIVGNNTCINSSAPLQAVGCFN